MIYQYYFSIYNFFRIVYYRSFSPLNEMQPYTIVKDVEKEDGNILLSQRQRI